MQKNYVKTLTSKQNIGILLLAADAIAASFLRDDRVVEGARLESVCAGNRTEGSNPSLSAT